MIGNGEAINVLRRCGVPEEQLVPVAGGERIPLFDRETRTKATLGEIDTADGPPGMPKRPQPSLAVASVDVWPSLHCMLPGNSHADVPDVIDTGKVYTGSCHFACTLDITLGMKYGLLKMGQHMPREAMDEGMRSFVDYVEGPAGNCLSNFDGGQLMYNFRLKEGVVLWNGHLGGYEGILRTVSPKPNLLIQAIAGRANLNGVKYDGSAAQFAAEVSKWLSEPPAVIWCLHDDSPIKPYRVDAEPATKLLEAETRSRVVDMKPGEVTALSTMLSS